MFDVGQKVRVVKIQEDEIAMQSENLVGREFNIKDVEPPPFEYPYLLEVDGVEIYFAEDELELVTI